MLNHVAPRELGWASVGIALAELLAPQKIQQMMGINPGRNTGLLRVLGVRELMSGIDLLSHRDPAPGVWSRIAGDALDGAIIAVAATKTRRPAGFAAVVAMVLGVVAWDVICAKHLGSSHK
jgi:hypothetical protein